MTRNALGAILLGTLLVAGAQDKAAADTDMQALRAAVQADKRGYVAKTLALNDAEAKKFWPIYDTYQRQLEQANRRRSVALVEVAGSAGPISDAHARNVVKELIAADDDELRARRKVRDRVSASLPPRKAIRYMQLEWKIRAAQNYDIATTIPLLAP
jgi:Spy/CpxP family protein refolding chaperone